MSRLFFLATLLLLTVAIVALLAPLPPPLLRLVAESSAPWLLTGHETDDGRIAGAGKRLLRGYVQISMAAHLAHRAGMHGGNDEEILTRFMEMARQVVLSPPSIDPALSRYDPSQWAALISGIGFCDQINGAVGLMSRRHFPRAELIALYLPKERTTPHTIGRVWSAQRKEWLYFDAFYAKPVIFRKGKDDEPLVVAAGPDDLSGARETAPPGIYVLPGWVLATFPSNLGTTIIERTRRKSAAGEQDGASVRPGTIMASQPPLVWPVPVPAPAPRTTFNDEVYRKMARAYVRARVSDILGEEHDGAYRAIGTDPQAQRDDRSAVMAAAARRFAPAIPGDVHLRRQEN